MRAGKSYVLGRVSLLTGPRARCFFAAFALGRQVPLLYTGTLSLASAKHNLSRFSCEDGDLTWEYGVPCHCRRATPYTQNFFSMLGKSLEQYQHSYLDLN